MINFIKGFIITLSTYTIIPLPQLKWDKNSIKYVFMFLPLVGLIIGSAEILWFLISKETSLNIILYGIISSLIPFLISGGIHIDGYIDTIDSLSSNKDKLSMQQILKDSRIGVFGALHLVIYFMLLFGLFCQIYSNNDKYYLLFIIVFFISRILGSFASITINLFKENGFLYTLTSATEKYYILIILFIYFIASLAFITYFFNLFISLTFILVIIFMHIYFINISKKFGGISGDLIGFYIQLSEIIFIILITVYGVLWS